jgi:putative ABC transport system permease protein
VLFAAVGLLLLIACANIANLLLARGAARRRELAVRAALGASRGRLVRQLLGESTLLAFAGGAAGLAAASGLLSLIHRIAGDSMPLVAAASLDVRAAAFAFGASLATAVLFGLLPAISASRGATSGALHGAGRQVGQGRTRWGWKAVIYIFMIMKFQMAGMMRGLRPSILTLYWLTPGME